MYAVHLQHNTEDMLCLAPVYNVRMQTWVDTVNLTFLPALQENPSPDQPSAPKPHPFNQHELRAPWLPRLHRHPGGTPADCCTESGKTGHQQIL